MGEVDEGAGGAATRRVVEHSDARCRELLGGRDDVIDAVGDLLDARTGPVKELGDRRIGGERSEQLNAAAARADAEHCLADPLLLVHLLVDHREPEGTAVEINGRVKVGNGNADVVDAREYGMHAGYRVTCPTPMREEPDMPEVRDSLRTLIEGAQAGDVRKIARLISKIEDGGDEAREAMRALAAYSGRAHVIGLTGAPGVGKSTTTSALVTALRAAGHRVAVLAVDPSSPFSGGALLGDRIRMQRHSGDDGVYIRSMASRGHLGGLSATTPQVIRVLDATGFDIVIIETVGVGQSEVEIAATADTSIVLLAPGMGDGIQAAKAGILEIGDIFVVNKADRDGADSTAREIRHMVELGTWSGWRPPVLKASAAQGTGIDEVVEAINEHRAWLEASGEDRARRHRRAREEITALVLGAVRERLAARADELMALGDAVLAGEIDAYEAAEALA